MSKILNVVTIISLARNDLSEYIPSESGIITNFQVLQSSTGKQGVSHMSFSYLPVSPLAFL